MPWCTSRAPRAPRTIPLAGLYRLPGDEPHRETTLERGDLITAVEVPVLGYSMHSAYRKVQDRASYAFGVASVAAALDVADGVVRDVRLALGAVAPLRDNGFKVTLVRNIVVQVLSVLAGIPAGDTA